MSQSTKALDTIKSAGAVRTTQTAGNPRVPDGAMARQRIELTLVSPDSIVHHP